MSFLRSWFGERIPVSEDDLRSVTNEPVPYHLKRWWFALGGTPAYDHNKYLRAHTVIQKLPDMARQVKVLANRVQKLEAADD